MSRNVTVLVGSSGIGGRLGLEETWRGLSVRGTDGSFIPARVRDVLFASLEQHVAPAVFEVRNDWPSGDVEWYEVVVLGMR